MLSKSSIYNVDVHIRIYLGPWDSLSPARHARIKVKIKLPLKGENQTISELGLECLDLNRQLTINITKKRSFIFSCLSIYFFIGRQKCVTVNLTMDSSSFIRWLSCDFHIFYNRSEFWDIIGQNDEKGHFDLFTSSIRY